jgi:ribosomal protein L6P/L9E
MSIDVSENNLVTVKGPLGELKQQIDPDIKLSTEDNKFPSSGKAKQNATSRCTDCTVRW